MIINAIKMPKQLALFVLMVSGTLIILSYVIFGDKQFSSSILFFIYVFPCIMVCFTFSNYIFVKENKIKILLMVSIIILGILNIIMSDNVYFSYDAMKIFVISGIMPLWTSMILFETDSDRRSFYYLSCIWLLVVVVVEIIHYLLNGGGFIFLNHAIPMGTLVILLMVGPLVLSASESTKIKVFSIALVSAGLILIFISNKRGTFLALAGMALAWLYYRYIRLSSVIIVSLFIVSIISYFSLHYYKSLDKNIPHHTSILHRLELYSFALHVYQKHPFLGTGLRAYSHEKYLSDYPIHNKSLDKFGDTVTKLETFENMALTSLIELGSIMTLLYVALIVIILYEYIKNTHPFARNNKQEFILLLPLCGLAIHSMTYDSLMFPQVNWLFHVQLGILSGLAAHPHHQVD